MLFATKSHMFENKLNRGAKFQSTNYNTILYFKITYKYVVIEKKETQRSALYQGSPKDKI